MITTYAHPGNGPIRPEDWVRRRFRLPPSSARLIVELAFGNRIAVLADHGITSTHVELREVHR